MNQFLKRIFIALGSLCILYVILVACTEIAMGQSPWLAKQFWCALAAAIIFYVMAWKLKQEAGMNFLLAIVSLLLVEGFLQILGWTGLLPGVNTKIKAPYARVYWTMEGRGNSTRNRFGWHYPEFGTAGRRRIALVGDSFVEAVEVPKTSNAGIRLETLLRNSGHQASVLAFGNHGTSPAYHREVIEYAARRFRVDEVVLCLYLGNDISDGTPALNTLPPQRFIYYNLDPAGALVLHPESRPIRDQFVRGLEFSHRSPIFTLAATIRSHLMSVQALASLKDVLAKRRAGPSGAAEGDDAIGARIRSIGLNPRVFRIRPDHDVEIAMTVLLQSVLACRDACERNGMKMRLALIPAFPNVFYTKQTGRDWTMQLEQYDFQAHERSIGAFARSNGIPVLELGQNMKNKQLDVAEIQKLYLTGGTGHFSEAGHRFLAEAVFETFYHSSEN